MYDFGHVSVETFWRAQTGEAPFSAVKPSQPQRRFFSRPDFRHASHFQPAWLEN
jgi:hypothetical protein